MTLKEFEAESQRMRAELKAKHNAERSELTKEQQAELQAIAGGDDASE